MTGTVKQYHVTVYATVDGAGNIVGWDICEPGSEPVDSGMPVFDEATEQWTYADGATAMLVDAAIAEDFGYDGPRGWTRGLEDLTSSIARLQEKHRSLERAVRDYHKNEEN